MAVVLTKHADTSEYGGHSAKTSYTKNPDGTVPEYVLIWRRYMERCGVVTPDQAYFLLSNDLRELSYFYGKPVD